MLSGPQFNLLANSTRGLDMAKPEDLWMWSSRICPKVIRQRPFVLERVHSARQWRAHRSRLGRGAEGNLRNFGEVSQHACKGALSIDAKDIEVQNKSAHF